MTDDGRFEELGDVEDLEARDPDDDDEFWEPVRNEPEGAMRSSPFAVAAFVVALLSASPLVQTYFNLGVIFDFSPITTTRVIRLVVGVVPAIALAIGAYWLAGRADEEIYVAAGRLGGVGFTHAARVVAAIAAAGLVTATLLQLFVRNDPRELELGPPPAEVEDDSGPRVEFEDSSP